MTTKEKKREVSNVEEEPSKKQKKNKSSIKITTRKEKMESANNEEVPLQKQKKNNKGPNKMNAKEKKRKLSNDEEIPPKKPKTSNKTVKKGDDKQSEIQNDVAKGNIHKSPTKENGKFEKKSGFKFNKKKPFVKGQAKGANQKNAEKVDWNDFKKKKKELREKRKTSNDLYSVTIEANRISEKLRRKTLEGGQEERNNLIDKLHKMLKENGNYEKFILKHDTSRTIQYLLKFSNEQIKREISKELIPHAVQMIQSKYGRYCVKRMLKYGNSETRSEIIKAFYGNAVKLSSHSISAPIFEYAYATFASPLHKRHLIQEFFGDMFKQSKEDNIQHLRDVYVTNTDMKKAALGATKVNLLKVLNKSLLDSSLVQTVLCQFLGECNPEDRAELISQLTNHVVVLSNSKDGARAVMRCIWHGTNKDRKTIIKTIKEYIVDLSKHEHGHTAIIGLLDAADDTVLIHKAIITPLLERAYEVASDDWGRKVILWLVAPADSAHFHPIFVKELEDGRKDATSKKDPEVRRKELLDYCIDRLLQQITSAPRDWLSTSSIAIVTLAILRAGSDKALENVYDSIVKALVDPDWKVKEDEEEFSAFEHPGLHMVFKKLLRHDKVMAESKRITFAERLVKALNEEIIKLWIQTNRGCFLLVFVLENGTEATQNQLKDLLRPVSSLIKKESSKGSKVLVKKLKE